VDSPWAQYFCCMLVGSREYVRNYPVVTKRVLRAIFFAECSLRSRSRQRPSVRSERLDFHRLAADLVVHGLDMVAADLPKPDFFDHSRGLADQRLLRSLAISIVLSAQSISPLYWGR
jgi:hypothetical protein